MDSDCVGDSDFDADQDGQDSLASGGPDCDDTDASIYAGADEAAGDGVDQDCDGADPSAPASPPACGCEAGAGAGSIFLASGLGAVVARRRSADGSASPRRRRG